MGRSPRPASMWMWVWAVSVSARFVAAAGFLWICVSSGSTCFPPFSFLIPIGVASHSQHKLAKRTPLNACLNRSKKKPSPKCSVLTCLFLLSTSCYHPLNEHNIRYFLCLLVYLLLKCWTLHLLVLV